MRLVLFFAISLMTVILVAAGNLLLGIFSRRWRIQWKNIIIRIWSRVTARILSIDICLKGTPPRPPFFLVSNHLSYIDVVPIWYSVKGTFIAKSEVESWPFFGWATRTLGIIFIDRELRHDVQRVNRLIASTITKEQGVIIFPEGTSTKGEEVKPFHASLLKYPAEHELPVSYATITYRSYDAGRPAWNHICWWGEMSFFSHFWKLLTIPGFEVTLTFGDGTINESNRKLLARRLRQAVANNFDPVSQPESQEFPHQV